MTRLIPLLSFILFCTISFCYTAISEEISYEELKKIQNSLASEKEHLSSLDNKTKKISKELSLFRQRMILLNEKISKNQNELRAFQTRRKKLEMQKGELEEIIDLTRDQKQNFLIILQKIALHPPLAHILNPDEKDKKIETAILLNSILPQLKEKAAILSANLESLSHIEEKLDQQETLEQNAHQKISQQYKELNSMLQQRGQIFTQSNQATKMQLQKIEQLSHKASDLKDLIVSLEKNQETLKPRAKSTFSNVISHFKGNSFSKDHTLPIRGDILKTFGQKTTDGSALQGIQIKASTQSTVVAPNNGKVLFVGPFRDYGNIIIIKHENDLHSLIAGFENIDSFVGHNVVTGEPLGTVQQTSTQLADNLIYYELRHKGVPIDPIKQIQ